MNPRVTLRQALEDPELLGSALAGPTWHAWRSLLIAAMGEPLTKDEAKTFTKFTGRTKAPDKRVDEFWCSIGRRGGKSRAMAVWAVYLAGLCDYPKLARGETRIFKSGDSICMLVLAERACRGLIRRLRRCPLWVISGH